MKKFIVRFIVMMLASAIFLPALATAACPPGEEEVAGFSGVCKKRRSDGDLQFKVPAGSNVGFRATKGAGNVYVYNGSSAPLAGKTAASANQTAVDENDKTEDTPMASGRIAIEGSARPEREFGALRISVLIARIVEIGVLGGYGGQGAASWDIQKKEWVKKPVYMVGGLLFFNVFNADKFDVQVGAVADTAILPGGKMTSTYLGGGMGGNFYFSKFFFANIRITGGAEKLSWEDTSRAAAEGSLGVGVHF